MTAGEALGQQGQQRSSLESGIDLISDETTVTFTQYQKWTFAVDGYVFWIRQAATQFIVKGSFHYATDRLQDEDQTIGQNHILFTAEQEISQFNDINPQTMWIGAWTIAGGPPLNVVFSQRGNYYQEADVWHYSGFAVYPALEAQLVDSAADLPEGPIVSNSLPIWLSFNDTAPVYPSFLVPDNVVPPYIVADIPADGTEALGSFPVIGPWPGDTVADSGESPLHLLSSFQLCRDRVKLLLYGFTNAQAISYLANLIDASTDDNSAFGFGSSPQIRDHKRVQVELAALAQLKSIEFVANYYQGAADAVARRLILSASINPLYIVGGRPAFGFGSIVQSPGTVSATGTVSE